MTGAVETAVFAALDERLDPRSDRPIAVAVSGGGDSVALLRLTRAWAERVGRPLLVLTVDHGLHPDSAAWSRFVVEAAAALGCPAQVLAWTGGKPATGLPAAARAVRHALLADAAREAGARVILLAHTADDIAEGERMRAEGSTLGRLRGWSSSPAWPEGRGLMLLRPMLGVTRADLRGWLTGQGAAWLEDPANADLRFSRARARAALAESAPTPPAPDTGPRLGAELARAFTAPSDAPGALRIGRAELVDASGAEIGVGAALLCASGRGRPPRGRAVAALVNRLRAGEVFTATLAGARVEAGPSAVLFGRDLGRDGAAPVPVEAGRTVVWDGRFEVTPEQEGVLHAAAGRLSRLPPFDRRALGAAPAWVRRTVPVLETADVAARLIPARSLAAGRLKLALHPPSTEAALG